MKVISIDDRLAVAPQIARQDFAELHSRGIRTIVNNRPDGEEPGQLAAAEAACIAAEHGIAYRHLPVTFPALSRRVVEEFSRTVQEADGPILAYCRSGTRSASLWVLAEALAGRMNGDEIVAFGRKLGLDFGQALVWLARETADDRALGENAHE